MNKEEPYRDQAERLKQRIQKINEKIEDSDQLPPREHVHRQKKKKTKWKLKYPVIRLLVLFFILLPIISFSVITYLDGKKMNRSEKTSGDSVGYETINLENTKKEKESKTVKTEEEKQVNQGNSEEPKNEVVQPETSSNTSVPTPSSNGGTIKQETDKNSQPKTETAKSNTNTSSNKTRIIYHTVQRQDTLYKLAIRYYHSSSGIGIIKKANHLHSQQINAGQVLKIPINN